MGETKFNAATITTPTVQAVTTIEKPGISPYETLNDEVLHRIFSYLSVLDLQNVSSVNRRSFAVAKSDDLWMQHFSASARLSMQLELLDAKWEIEISPAEIEIFKTKRKVLFDLFFADEIGACLKQAPEGLRKGDATLLVELIIKTLVNYAKGSNCGEMSISELRQGILGYRQELRSAEKERMHQGPAETQANSDEEEWDMAWYLSFQAKLLERLDREMSYFKKYVTYFAAIEKLKPSKKSYAEGFVKKCILQRKFANDYSPLYAAIENALPNESVTLRVEDIFEPAKRFYEVKFIYDCKTNPFKALVFGMSATAEKTIRAQTLLNSKVNPSQKESKTDYFSTVNGGIVTYQYEMSGISTEIGKGNPVYAGFITFASKMQGPRIER